MMSLQVTCASLCAGTLALFIAWLLLQYWVYKWRNPPCKGISPPGSMGLPIVGESIQFFKTSYSLDIPDFYKLRLKRYGPIFKTSLVGQPLVVSADPEVNRFIFQQEGKLFRSWYPEAANIIIGEKTIDGFHGAPHKFIRNSIYKLFGLEYLKHNLLPELEAAIRNNFAEWATKYAIDIHDSTPDMIIDLVAKKLVSLDPSESRELTKNYSAFLQGLISFPLYVPGTTFYQCMQEEHEAVVRNRGDANSGFTWEEYKSLTFTTMVVNELTRMSNATPGVFRKTMTDVQLNGYTIPAGWMVMVCPMAVHLNPEIFEDPLSFNPWRWQDESQRSTLLKNFMPYGLGIRTCPAADFSKLFTAIFLHVLVTNYRWVEINDGEVARMGVIIFPNGYKIKLIPTEGPDLPSVY